MSHLYAVFAVNLDDDAGQQFVTLFPTLQDGCKAVYDDIRDGAEGDPQDFISHEGPRGPNPTEDGYEVVCEGLFHYIVSKVNLPAGMEVVR